MQFNKISFPHSRIHPLSTFHTPQTKIFVKRDDELGFGISGSKLRKYASLIPYLIDSNCQEAALIGSAYSNNILGLSQLLIENRIQPTLFLLGNPSQRRQGNLLLTSLLVDEAHIHWIDRKNWPGVEALAKEYVQNSPFKGIVIPEGACMEAALPGACTLALDIVGNERAEGLSFDHVLMDAGTGLSAIAAILMLAFLKKETTIHVVLLAEEKEAFMAKLHRFLTTFNSFYKCALQLSDLHFSLYYPEHARSFGHVNAKIMQWIKWLARHEGFFTDPVYSAKLFLEARGIIKHLSGNILIVHSGGALTLMGFIEKL